MYKQFDIKFVSAFHSFCLYILKEKFYNNLILPIDILPCSDILIDGLRRITSEWYT